MISTVVPLVLLDMSLSKNFVAAVKSSFSTTTGQLLVDCFLA